MNKDSLSHRMNLLQQQKKLLQEEQIKVAANINAFNGAIEECQYWINQAVAEEEKVMAAADYSEEDGSGEQLAE